MNNAQIKIKGSPMHPEMPSRSGANTKSAYGEKILKNFTKFQYVKRGRF
jgi:hypothetical protein